jgi:hypothetical protein
MTEWLVDDPSTIYLLLGIVAAGFGIAAWSSRKRVYAIGLGVALALIAVVWALGFFIDTDLKQIKRKTQAMADAVGRRDIDGIFKHISNDFSFHGRLKKNEFRDKAAGYINRGEVTGFKVWDVRALDISREKKTAIIAFKTKGMGSAFGGYDTFNCKAIFALDPDGEWRMKDFYLYMPHVDPQTGQDLHIPI